ncbi:tRNA-dihydrouridine synthase, partial [Baffinella frigidus]
MTFSRDEHRLSVAPMMEWSDRHYRFLVRQITQRTLLYTEMIVGEDLLKKDTEGRALLLDCSPEEFPGLVLQLGGADPTILRDATQVAVEHAGHPWHSINLNCGCPSSRVTESSRQFGARLMHDAEQVRECVTAMASASGGIPITVKCRLGTDSFHGYENLSNFISTVSGGTGVKHFDIHARECVLA